MANFNHVKSCKCELRSLIDLHSVELQSFELQSRSQAPSTAILSSATHWNQTNCVSITHTCEISLQKFPIHVCKGTLLFLLSYHIMLKQFACLFYWTCLLVCIPIEIQNNNLTWYPPTSKGKARKMIRFTKFRAPFLKGVRSNVPPVPILRSWKRVASFWNNTATRRIFQHFTESLETQIKPMKSPDKKEYLF